MPLGTDLGPRCAESPTAQKACVVAVKKPTLHQELHNLSIFKVHPVVIGYGKAPSPVKSWLNWQCIEHHQHFGLAQLVHSFVAYCYR